MQKSAKLLMFVSAFLLLVFAGVAFLYFKATPKDYSVSVVTEKGKYANGEELKVEIDNNEGDSICFSSCYPYFMQIVKGGNWQNYKYSDCQKDDVVEKCISSKDLKAFGITLDSVQSAIHRLAIPACIGCSVGDKFRVDKVFYSNEFEINK